MNQNLWLETKDIFKRIIKLDPFVKKQNWSPQKMVMERIFPCYKTKWNCPVVRKWSFFKKGKYHKILALTILEILAARLLKFQPEIWKEQDSRLRLRLLVQLLKFKFWFISDVSVLPNRKNILTKKAYISNVQIWHFYVSALHSTWMSLWYFKKSWNLV